MSVAINLRCSYCHQPIANDQPHVRQAKLDLEGLARAGEFDAYHVDPCYLELYGITPPPAPTEDPDQ